MQMHKRSPSFSVYVDIGVCIRLCVYVWFCVYVGVYIGACVCVYFSMYVGVCIKMCVGVSWVCAR